MTELVHNTVAFDYDEAFSRNIGWLTRWEQLQLRDKRVAIAGTGGVGGVHVLTLSRLGVGGFRLSDMDVYETANFNRQIGATVDTIGRPKVDVITEMALAINPDMQITTFPNGITSDNIDEFLDGADIFVDGLDFFALDIRARVFARCAERGIPAVTAAPLGFSTAYLIYMPGGMTFEQYFRFAGLPADKQALHFFLGLAPSALQRPSLVDWTRLDLANKRGPSTMTGVQLCSGVVGAQVCNILLGRQPIHAMPWYHQFDASQGRFVRRKLSGGNRNPVQRLKIRLAGAKLLTAPAWPAASTSDNEIERILDLGRWAPSGDNGQPWRFEITGADSARIHIRDVSDDDVYDYEGRPSRIASGCLLETMRVAATQFGRGISWSYENLGGHRHVLDVEFSRRDGITRDPLVDYIESRSVDRRAYQRTPLTAAQKAALEGAMDDDLRIVWFESIDQRRRESGLNARSTDIRLRIPETYPVHRRILDWDHRLSPDAVPAEAIGLDPLTLRMMHWSMASWERTNRLNGLPGGTVVAQQAMDIRPGLGCAAHFAIVRTKPIAPERDAEGLITAGMSWQRFWLTATRLGLVMQPAFAPIIFSYYGRHDIAFTTDKVQRAAAIALARDCDAGAVADPADILIRGRIGVPQSRRVTARSVRLPLSELMVKASPS